ncbi:Xaa-Pro aminopeptidase [Amphibacillus sp. Q70]|uniref:Xaa-Pro aminopeptidase n=1 Tax=Amphibacillus sp. Q70 TaxID=3453416 RepID=UPI003F87F608
MISLESYLKEAKIDTSLKIGLVDWKLLSDTFDDFNIGSAIPSFIVNAIENIFDKEKVLNATSLYLHPQEGVRTTNNTEEILKYEYGASLASDAILDGLSSLREGVSELEIGDKLNLNGQYQSVVTISAFGQRFTDAYLYPKKSKLSQGDKVALTVAYKGGLSSRSGYAVSNEEELEEIDPGYLEKVVIPYIEAYKWWLENIKLDAVGGEFYNEFDKFYPADINGWDLCPGHLVSDEEWLSSPFYKDSTDTVKSGNIFQVDFIPNVPNHNGVSAESTIAICSEELRQEIQNKYPEFWERIKQRKEYLRVELGLSLSEEIIPLASTLGYYQPFMLNNNYSMTYS